MAELNNHIDSDKFDPAADAGISRFLAPHCPGVKIAIADSLICMRQLETVNFRDNDETAIARDLELPTKSTLAGDRTFHYVAILPSLAITVEPRAPTPTVLERPKRPSSGEVPLIAEDAEIRKLRLGTTMSAGEGNQGAIVVGNVTPRSIFSLHNGDYN